AGAGDVVRLGKAVELERRRRGRQRRAHAVEVVLAEEDDGQLPERGEVQRLVELALVHRTVAEDTQAKAAVALFLRGERQAAGDRQMPRNDGVAAEEVAGLVEKVHRAALPVADPGCAAEQLGHDGTRRQTLCYGVPVVAIVTDDVVVLAQGG